MWGITKAVWETMAKAAGLTLEQVGGPDRGQSGRKREHSTNGRADLNEESSQESRKKKKISGSLSAEMRRKLLSFSKPEIILFQIYALSHLCGFLLRLLQYLESSLDENKIFGITCRDLVFKMLCESLLGVLVLFYLCPGMYKETIKVNY